MSGNAIRFSKMHGLGNDFVVINTLNQVYEPLPEQICAWGNRYTGIGFDQLLIITQPFSSSADFGYAIFNADGSSAQQCGNGVRCIAHYLHRFGLTQQKNLVLETTQQQMQVTYHSSERIAVNMGIPHLAPASLPFRYPTQQSGYELTIDDQPIHFGAVSMGNPHIVIPVRDLNKTDVVGLGSILCHHPAFPEQVNVGFLQVINRQYLKLRVFERGAGETLACGSGACAAMVVARLWDIIEPNCQVELPGGILNINWHHACAPVEMIGPAQWIFDGEIK